MLYLPDEDFPDPTIDHTANCRRVMRRIGSDYRTSSGTTNCPFAKPSEHRDHWSFDLRVDRLGRLTGQATWSVLVFSAHKLAPVGRPCDPSHRASRYLGQDFWRIIQFGFFDTTRSPNRTDRCKWHNSGGHHTQRQKAFIDSLGLHHWRLVEQFAPAAQRRHPTVSLHGTHTQIEWSLKNVHAHGTTRQTRHARQ